MDRYKGSQILRMSRGKRSFWKSSVSVFGKASWKTLVLEVFPSEFLGKPRGKHSKGGEHEKGKGMGKAK